MTVQYFYCWASGLAEFGQSVPDGAIRLSQQTAKQYMEEVERLAKIDEILRPMTWREKMTIMCRLTKTKPVKLLIPGIPEATTDKERTDALFKFQLLINARLRGRK